MRKPQMQDEPKPPFSKQKLEQPGLESEMDDAPRWQAPEYQAAGKLEGKSTLVTGGDSGIGRAVAVLYAREGADVAIVYLPEEQEDAEITRRAIEAEGRHCLMLAGDLSDPDFCREVIDRVIGEHGKLDVLVSNAAYQARKESLEDIEDEEWDHTFRTNVYAFYRLVKHALPHLKPGASIIATSSITGIEGSPQLLDYSATKGAINAFTKEVARFGGDTAYKRPAQPEEIAPAYVFFASDADSSYITGEVLAELGGDQT